MLLFFKGIGFGKKVSIPGLTVVLSCWDEIEGIGDNKNPSELLHEQLPLFHEFIHANWNDEHLNVIGLSSQGRKLDKEKGDVTYDYEEEGYIVSTDGSKSNDLTELLKFVI